MKSFLLLIATVAVSYYSDCSIIKNDKMQLENDIFRYKLPVNVLTVEH